MNSSALLFISIINLLFHSNLVCVQVQPFYNNHDQPLCFSNKDQSCSLIIKKFDNFKFEIIASHPNFRSVASYIQKTFDNKLLQSKQRIISEMMERQGRLFFDLLTFVCCLVRWFPLSDIYFQFSILSYHCCCCGADYQYEIGGSVCNLADEKSGGGFSYWVPWAVELSTMVHYLQ